MLQAVGASMMNPVAMSIITNVFIEPKARARAIGTWGAVVGVSMGLGPLIGGLLTQTVGWRSIFWINVPIGALAIVLAQLFVPDSKAPRARRADPLGQLLMLGALASVTYAVIEGPRLGWGSPLVMVLFAGAAVAVALLLVFEPRMKEPLLDLRFFRSMPFSSATMVAVLAFGAFSGFLFLNALYLQEVRGLAAFTTGLFTLPLALGALVCSPISGWLVGRSGTRLPLVMAGSGIALSALVLATLDTRTSLVRIVLAYLIFGAGFGLVNAPITNTAVSGMPRAQAGLAAAIASTSRQVGAALGVAIGGTIAQGRHGASTELTFAMRPFFVLATLAGLGIVALGIFSSSAPSLESARRTAALIEEGDRPAPGGAS
jgi:EmrB/QacA subfamily drug resistance transporter